MSGINVKTPTKKVKTPLGDVKELHTPIKIPPSPFLQQIGYGCGVNVFTLERSPKVGFARSPWAIKKRNTKVMKDEKFNDRIRLEAKILRLLNHPNIVGFRAFTEVQNGEPCLAMEKLDESLGDMIEDRSASSGDPFPANTILKVAFEVAKGLEYLHHIAHILHGDVKSYNILVSKDCNIIKLCDFGVSVPLTDSLEMDTSKKNFQYIGTECWNAPEIIFEDGAVTNKADMWSYGLVLWEMIALLPPHVESSEEPDLESSFNDTLSQTSTATERPEITDDSFSMLDEVTNPKFGTRPALPAIEMGEEYKPILEIFFTCTLADYKLRPNARGVVMYFKNYLKY